MTFRIATTLALLLLPFSISAAAQRVSPPQPPAQPAPAARIAPSAIGDSERSKLVDPNVNFDLCVTRGRVSINGWDRSEVRVMITSGQDVDLTVIQPGPNGTPAWVRAVTRRPPGSNVYSGECLDGETIDIDVPNGATVSTKGQEARFDVNDIRKFTARIAAGDITASNIAAGVTATTFRGDILVNGGSGPMDLETTSGNIVIAGGAPREIGDTLRAKTVSGVISMRKVSYLQVDARSVTGVLDLTGDVAPASVISMNTTSGSIRLALPSATGGTLAATYRVGNFSSAFPVETITEQVRPGTVKQVVGKLGSGGSATLKLQTDTGNISIRKQ